MPETDPFDHFVITRFTAVFTSTQPPAADDWLRYRLRFFADGPCSALARQTGDVRFRWLRFFDRPGPTWFPAAVESLATGLFEPIWTSEPFWNGLTARAVSERA